MRYVNQQASSIEFARMIERILVFRIEIYIAEICFSIMNSRVSRVSCIVKQTGEHMLFIRFHNIQVFNRTVVPVSEQELIFPFYGYFFIIPVKFSSQICDAIIRR